MKIIFMGTPEFAVPALRAVFEAGHQVIGVFTQPDRPSGRGNKITSSPVKKLAESFNLPVFQPVRIKTREAVDLIKELEPDCIIVVAFGQILSKEILDIPQYGCVNVHASLLPWYRGAAPIHWAILNGESTTGVTTMLMDEGLDTGDMLLAQEYEISLSATTGEVHDALAEIGALVLIRTLEQLEEGTLVPRIQPEKSTYAPLLKREHEKLDWSWDALKIHNRIRGMNPWPGAFTTFREEQVKIWQSTLALDSELKGRELFSEILPGQIIALTEIGFQVRTGDNVLEIIELQPAGKKKMTAHDFFNGRRVKPGEFFV